MNCCNMAKMKPPSCQHTTSELQVMKHGYGYEPAMEHAVKGRHRLHLGSKKGGQTSQT